MSIHHNISLKNEPAMEISRRHLTENSIGVERAACGEASAGTFDVCWSCGADLGGAK